MREINKDELKSIQLDILNSVVDFCNANQINYFLIGGTLLGSIKYKGFIPWDDDIDIGMTREHYEKFITLFEKQEGDYYLYYNHKNNKKCPFTFTKICKKQTLVLENYVKNENLGINIDLFPIDSFGNFSCGKKLFYKIFLIRKLMGIKNSNTTCNSLINIGKKIIKYISSPISNYRLNSLITYLIKKEPRNENNKNFSAQIVWGHRNIPIIPSDCYEDLISVEFEGKKYHIIREYDFCLKYIYGNNYSEPLPKEKQVTHHYFRAFVEESI